MRAESKLCYGPRRTQMPGGEAAVCNAHSVDFISAISHPPLPQFAAVPREPLISPNTMTKSYAQIVKQIKALEAEAEKARRTEIDGVITRIREAVQFYNLTAADLGLTVKAKPESAKSEVPAKRKKRKAAAKTTAVAKYTDGQGNTWVGRGKRPQWLRDGLAAGKQLSDFLIK